MFVRDGGVRTTPSVPVEYLRRLTFHAVGIEVFRPTKLLDGP